MKFPSPEDTGIYEFSFAAHDIPKLFLIPNPHSNVTAFVCVWLNCKCTLIESMNAKFVATIDSHVTKLLSLPDALSPALVLPSFYLQFKNVFSYRCCDDS